MEKTLGQIHIDAYEAGPTGEKGAHAIAAVARHVVAEAIAAHVAECHRLKARTVKVDDDESAMMIGYEEQPQPEAGDWAMETALKILCHSFSQESMANAFREAAARHYGEQLGGLKTIIAALEEEKLESQQKIDWLEGHCLKHQRDLEKSESEAEQLSFDLSGERAVVAVRNAEIESLKTRVEREVENREASNREAMKFCKERDEAWRRRDVLAIELLEVRESRKKIANERERQCDVATAAIRDRDEACQERDAALAECEMLRSADRSKDMSLAAALAEVEQLKKQPDETSCLGVLMGIGNLLQLPGPIVNPGDVLAAVTKLNAVANAAAKPDADVSKFDTPPASTGDDELKQRIIDAFAAWRQDPRSEQECDEVAYDAVWSLFDALRRERDEAKSSATASQLEHARRLEQRAESAESALGELREAMLWHWDIDARKQRSCWRNGDRFWHTYVGGSYDNPADAILDAYRATKAASVAAEGTVTS